MKLLYTNHPETKVRYEHNYRVTIAPFLLLFVTLITAGVCLLITSILF